MVHLVTGRNRDAHRALIAAMHRDRKRIFVDWLGWKVPHTDSAEADQFDDDAAEYLIVDDREGRHLGSVRLLPTDGPHLLRDVFPDLCEVDLPTGPTIREITRLCVSPDCPRDERRGVRRQLLTVLVEYALLAGIDGYTLITELPFLARVAAVGWRCEMLGHPRIVHGAEIGAVRVFVDPHTVADLRATGVYADAPLVFAPALMAA